MTCQHSEKTGKRNYILQVFSFLFIVQKKIFDSRKCQIVLNYEDKLMIFTPFVNRVLCPTATGSQFIYSFNFEWKLKLTTYFEQAFFAPVSSSQTIMYQHKLLFICRFSMRKFGHFAKINSNRDDFRIKFIIIWE